MPNNQVKYLKYTYTQPSGYTVDSSSYTSTNLANNVTNKVFSASSRIDQKAAYSNQAYGSASANISTASYGGSIYNHTSNSSIDITSDFNGSSLIQTLTGGTALAGEDYTYAEDDFASSTDGSASANADAYASAWAEANASSSAYGGAIGNTSSGSLGNVKVILLKIMYNQMPMVDMQKAVMPKLTPVMQKQLPAMLMLQVMMVVHRLQLQHQLVQMQLVIHQQMQMAVQQQAVVQLAI